MRVDIKAPLTKEEAAKLRAGDIVSLTGYIYTGRDAAHKSKRAAGRRSEPAKRLRYSIKDVGAKSILPL